jgi:hypothetical protein
VPIKPSELQRQLTHKFKFVPAKNRSSDHQWLELQLPGIVTIRTKLSHSKAELRARLLGIIARELRVNSAYLNEMVVCTKGQDEYYEHLKTAPVSYGGM